MALWDEAFVAPVEDGVSPPPAAAVDWDGPCFTMLMVLKGVSCLGSLRHRLRG